MATPKTIIVADDIFAELTRRAEAEGVSVDEAATDSIRRDLLRRDLRAFVRLNRADATAMGLTEADVPRLIAESRAERRR